MKSKVFKIDPQAPSTNCTVDGEIFIYEFNIPLAPAYAIEYYTIHYGGLSAFPGNNDHLQQDKLRLEVEANLETSDDCRITIFYHAIRDYKFLFPSITPLSLQERMGNFYREAELAFDSSSWLTFALMCGALFEGVLYFKLGLNNKAFNELISSAKSVGIIDSQEELIMNMVRQYRNLVHSNRHTTQYVSRVDAMDIKITLDKLLLKISS